MRKTENLTKVAELNKVSSLKLFLVNFIFTQNQFDGLWSSQRPPANVDVNRFLSAKIRKLRSDPIEGRLGIVCNLE